MESTAAVIQDFWVHRNGIDVLARVQPQDPNEKSFLAIIPRQLHDLLNRIQKGVAVMLSEWREMRLPAIVEVLDDVPPPIEVEAPHCDDVVKLSRALEIAELDLVEAKQAKQLADSAIHRQVALVAILRGAIC